MTYRITRDISQGINQLKHEPDVVVGDLLCVNVGFCLLVYRCENGEKKIDSQND